MTGEDLLDQRRARARQPDNKNGVGCLRTCAAPCLEEFAGEQALRASYPFVVLVGIVGLEGQTDPASGFVVHEGFFVVPAILERLPQRIVEMQPVIGFKSLALQRSAHPRGIVGRKTECLQICERPESLAKRRLERDRVPVGRDAIRAAPGSFQRMTITHPHLGLLRVVVQNRLVDADRFSVIAKARQDRSFEIAISRIARLL